MIGEHLDWDNLRYFLAVARAGKLTAAARRLGQDHTTVGRRIASLESTFRSKLFEQRPEGYRLTETGQRLYENVKTVESSVCELQRDLAGQTQHVEGVVRIGAPDDFGNLFLAKHIGELQSLHPGLKIELIILPYMLIVSKREADISIGVERPAEGRLFVRRLPHFEMRLYATRGYIDAHGPIDQLSDLARQTWIGPVSDFNATTLMDAATELVCTPTLRFACSSFAGQLAAAINGAGVAMLPRYVADQERSLAPVLSEIVKTMRAYHMVVHADLRDLPRVRAVTNYIGQKVTEARALFVPSPIRSNQSRTSSLPTWLAPEALTGVAGQGRQSVSALGRLKPAALADGTIERRQRLSKGSTPPRRRSDDRNFAEEIMSRIFDPKVFQLGYVGLGCADLEKTTAHYLNNLGLSETAKGDDGATYLSIGYEHHNVILKQTDQKSLLSLGYQLKPNIEIANFVKELRDLGLRPETKSDSQPGIASLIEVEAVAGHVLQFYSRIESPAPGFKEGGVAPLRLGHVAVISPEADKLRRFYEDFLGFWYTDEFEGIATFLTCNRDHHVINFVHIPESRVHHIAFQLKDNAAHPSACDKLTHAGTPTLWGPSRHTAGHNLASYHYDPERVLVELYTEMDVFIPELGMCEARPWHEHFPMKPRVWKLTELNASGSEFAFNLGQG